MLIFFTLKISDVRGPQTLAQFKEHLGLKVSMKAATSNKKNNTHTKNRNRDPTDQSPQFWKISKYTNLAFWLL